MVLAESREERLSKLSLDYRVALAHSPIQPQHVHEVRAAWLKEDEYEISYGFVLSYRSRWVYLYGTRYARHEAVTHTVRWYDKEPGYLYGRAHAWDFEVGEILNGPYFLSDEEAGRQTEDRDNSDPE
jgi:hypothetical protein